MSGRSTRPPVIVSELMPVRSPGGSVNPAVRSVSVFDARTLVAFVLSSLVEGPRDALRGLRGGGRGWTLLAVAGGWFFLLGLRFVVPALLPTITEDFPVSNATAGAAITLLWITYAFMQFPAGALVDRLGERRLLVASLVASAAGLVGYAVSPTFGVFLAATALFGLGSGLYGPPRGTVLSRTFPDRDGAAFGTTLAAGSLGAAVLPVAATLVAGIYGWRAAIGVTVPAFLLLAGALWWAVPRHRPARADGGLADARAFAGSIRTAIDSRGVVLAVVGATLMLFAFQGLTAFFTTYLVEAKSLSEGEAGGLLGVLFLAGAVAQPVCGGLADRYGAGRVLTAVAFLGVLPLLALPFLSGIVPLAIVAAALGVRLSMGPVSNAYIVSLLPADVRGTAWGFLRTVFFTVGAFGSTAVGAMADRQLFGEAFLVLAALTGLAGVVYLFLPAREAS
jgi:predicted MFS family arabinose efflux permease